MCFVRLYTFRSQIPNCLMKMCPNFYFMIIAQSTRIFGHRVLNFSISGSLNIFSRYDSILFSIVSNGYLKFLFYRRFFFFFSLIWSKRVKIIILSLISNDSECMKRIENVNYVKINPQGLDIAQGVY